MKMVPHLIPIPSHLVKIVFFVGGSVLINIFIVCLSEEDMFFISGVQGSCCNLNGCCSNVFLDLEKYLFRGFEFQFGEKVSCCVDWASNVCYFEAKLQQKVTCVLQRWWNCFHLEETHDWLVICQNVCQFRCFSWKVCELNECDVGCWKFFRVKGYFSFSAWEKTFDPNATGVHVLRFDWIFWSGLFSIMREQPALLKLALVMRTSCLPGVGCFSANSHALLSASFFESNVPLSSDVRLTGTSDLRKL